jgi:hypothetical protein
MAGISRHEAAHVRRRLILPAWPKRHARSSRKFRLSGLGEDVAPQDGRRLCAAPAFGPRQHRESTNERDVGLAASMMPV